MQQPQVNTGGQAIRWWRRNRRRAAAQPDVASAVDEVTPELPIVQVRCHGSPPAATSPGAGLMPAASTADARALEAAFSPDGKRTPSGRKALMSLPANPIAPAPALRADGPPSELSTRVPQPLRDTPSAPPSPPSGTALAIEPDLVTELMALDSAAAAMPLDTAATLLKPEGPST